MKLNKYEMVLEILTATGYITTIPYTERLLKRVDTISIKYIRKIYKKFQNDRNNAELYLELITQ